MVAMIPSRHSKHCTKPKHTNTTYIKVMEKLRNLKKGGYTRHNMCKSNSDLKTSYNWT